MVWCVCVVWRGGVWCGVVWCGVECVPASQHPPPPPPPPRTQRSRRVDAKVPLLTSAELC